MQELHAIAELLAMLVLEPRTALLIALLAIAAGIDLQTYRIPNWLTAGGVAAAMAFAVVEPVLGYPTWLGALVGLTLGMTFMLPAYLLRVMGAGDVKLMSMTGAFLGPDGVIGAALLTFVVGGALALAFAMTRSLALPMFSNIVAIARTALFTALARMSPSLAIPSSQSLGRLPYGVSIACGTTIFLVLRQLGYL